MSRQRAESASAALLTTCSRRTAPGARSGGLQWHLRRLTSNRLSRSRPGLLPRTTAATASLYECRRNYVAPWDVFPRPKKIAVVGGGLTGLVAAFYLARDLPESSKIVVYEASDRWGGWINTQIINPQVEGRGNCKVLLETGPRVFSTHNRYDLMVFHDLKHELSLNFEGLQRDPKRYILQGDSLVHFPSKVGLDMIPFLFEPVFRNAILPSAWHYISNRDSKVPFDQDVSVGEWLRYFTNNDAIVDDVASAMLHGIWGDNVHKISALSALYRIWHKQAGTWDNGHLTNSDVRLVSALGHKDQRNVALFHHPLGGMYHFAHKGMQWLPQNLAETLETTANVELRKGTAVEDMQYDSETQEIKILDKNGKTESFNKVISTVEASQLDTATKGKLPTLKEFGAVTINAVNLWYPAEYPSIHNLQGVGYLIPNQTLEQNPERALGVFFDNEVGVGGVNYWDPEAKQSYETGTKLFVLLGGHHYDGMTPPGEAESIELARQVVQRHLGIPSTDPVYAYASTKKNCIPKHNVGHSTLITKLREEALKTYTYRLSIVGGSFHRPGLLGALRSGWEAAHAVVRGDSQWGGLDEWTEEQMLDPVLAKPDHSQYPWRPMTPTEAGWLFMQGEKRF